MPKDTAQNVEQAREFVVNLVHPEAAEVMHKSAAAFPPDVRREAYEFVDRILGHTPPAR